ncbi:hypothetical protein BT63DRAFT_468100 [Microthyrium microscopicum]|uniref:Uncharacterized protein n=1 Tax=Microthyrium microscopicum TaxID=703497 RepID=A0A6A6UKW7_9PEZI|nr:hypothetical protein BT63DRAFT_468100 [Microthyrium microscopicum]
MEIDPEEKLFRWAERKSKQLTKSLTAGPEERERIISTLGRYSEVIEDLTIYVTNAAQKLWMVLDRLYNIEGIYPRISELTPEFFSSTKCSDVDKYRSGDISAPEYYRRSEKLLRLELYASINDIAGDMNESEELLPLGYAEDLVYSAIELPLEGETHPGQHKEILQDIESSLLVISKHMDRFETAWTTSRNRHHFWYSHLRRLMGDRLPVAESSAGGITTHEGLLMFQACFLAMEGDLKGPGGDILKAMEEVLALGGVIEDALVTLVDLRG